MTANATRRDFLLRGGGGCGALALAALMAGDGGTHRGAVADEIDRASFKDPLTPRPPPAPRAKRVIYLFMAGATSHLELFDNKPELASRRFLRRDFREEADGGW